MKPYIFSKKDRRFLSVGIPKMKELEEEGLKFGVRSKEKGISKLKRYMDRQLQRGKKDIEFK